LYVVVLTAVMMVVEIVTGCVQGSMALVADGWHMGTHVAVLGISLFAYRCGQWMSVAKATALTTEAALPWCRKVRADPSDIKGFSQ
jgi:Co/Zn/Cd efflux system component